MLLDRRKWYSFKRLLLWKSSEKAQADQGVASCSAAWGPGPNGRGYAHRWGGGHEGQGKAQERAHVGPESTLRAGDGPRKRGLARRCHRGRVHRQLQVPQDLLDDTD